MAFEFTILDALQKIHTPVLDKIMVFFTTLGGIGIIWIALILYLLINKKTRRMGFLVMVALILEAVLCSGILKHIFHRTRPCDINTAVHLLVRRPRDYSFPSGHTGAAFAVIAGLIAAGDHKYWKVMLPIGIIIAFSRMYLYVHFPTDILGGLVLGILCGIFGVRLGNTLLKYRHVKAQN